MTNIRLEYLRSSSIDDKLKLSYKDFSLPEILELMDKTVLCPIERLIARLRFAQGLSIDAISVELEIEKDKVQGHIDHASKKIKQVITTL